MSIGSRSAPCNGDMGGASQYGSASALLRRRKDRLRSIHALEWEGPKAAKLVLREAALERLRQIGRLITSP
jgi:hypothetical protein